MLKNISNYLSENPTIRRTKARRNISIDQEEWDSRTFTTSSPEGILLAVEGVPT